MANQVVLTVGVGEQFSTIHDAIVAADQMGGNADIKVNAGTYTNDGGYLYDGINNVTVEGVGGMVKIVDPTYYAGGKAAIVTGGQNILLKNLDISGVTVPDQNGAGVRYDQGTLTLDNVALHGNQDGILGAADPNGSITIQNSEIYGNGVGGDGRTHNIYIGDIAQFTLTNSYIHDANLGHEVKSRAENNTITGNVIADNSSSASYSIDLPNGGNATITNNVIEQGANSPNHVINAYGEEGSLHAGTAVNFSGNTVVNDNGNGAGPVWWNAGGAVITGSGNSAWNVTDLGSGVAASSVTQLSSRPTINTSSVGVGASASSSGSASLQPTIASITGNSDGGVTLRGHSNANSVVTITDTVGGNSTVVGSVTAGANGAWTLTNHTKINFSAINSFSASATDAAGDSGSMAGALILTDTGADHLTAVAGASEIFSIMSFKGSDVIDGFQTASSAGATHDYVNFSGRGITSFAQVQMMMSGSSSTLMSIGSAKTITLTGVAPTSLTAADFRFS